MTAYPNNIDTDNELPAVDDNNVSEIGGDVINRLRDAIFAIEQTLGIEPHGTAGSVAQRINTSLDESGNLRPEALTSLGLLTNIIDSQVSANAGIKETKLALDYSTAALYNNIFAVASNLSVLNTHVTNVVYTDLLGHIGGQQYISSDQFGRHVASNIDVNPPGADPRDQAFVSSGLLNKTGGVRPANLMSALLEINNELVTHETSSVGQHVASAISLITNSFGVIPTSANNVQAAIDFIDNMAEAVYNEHRAIMHSNGIPRSSRSEDFIADGYANALNTAVVCETFLDWSNHLIDLVKVHPDGVTTHQLDELFRRISVGDSACINYGGFIARFYIKSINHVPGSIWNFKIDGIHLENKQLSTPTYPAYVTFEKTKFDENNFGILAVAAANHNLWAANPGVPGSVIVVPPSSPQMCGMDLNLDELDSTHRMLYIHFYPDGNPANGSIELPGIDVTGNLGITPGAYTLDDVISNVNSAFRSAGYNYRMVAFEYKGQFGLAVADNYGNAGFSVVAGQFNNSNVLTPYGENNVIGNDREGDYKDALGLGIHKANVASPKYVTPTSASTSFPTTVFIGRSNKNYSTNGAYRSALASDPTVNTDGYWDATIIGRTVTAASVETTYEVALDLTQSRITTGSTIVVLPVEGASYSTNDYGRFIVKNVTRTGCPSTSAQITVVNAIHGTGSAIDSSLGAGTSVKIYFGFDSVSFSSNVYDENIPGNTKRYFELFVNMEGKTEAYERARFAIDSVAGLIDTYSLVTTTKSNGWHIYEVSPKFKGYPEVGGSTGRKYVRFYIFNYDSTTKAYDGYVKQVDATNQTVYVGPITRVRKGEVGRYYDDSGVDYIEIGFNEPYSSNVDILSSSSDIRYLDIEIFQTESDNDEFMRLAFCEQLYLAANINGGVIDYVKDKRNFGNVGEKDLTDSALGFIESNSRLMHENGVINGFDFVKTDGNKFSFFNGGIGHVGGRIVNKNSFSVKVNAMFPFGSSATSYAASVVICLTSHGTIELVPVGTITVVTRFAVSGGSRYERIYTIPELIENRKDLLPLWVINYTCEKTVDGEPVLAAITDCQDFRRFIRSGSVDELHVSGISLYSETNASSTALGNFASLQAAVNYAKAISLRANTTILVKGRVYLPAEVVISSNITIEGAPNNQIVYTGQKALNIGNITTSIPVSQGMIPIVYPDHFVTNVRIKGLNFLRKLNRGTGAQPYAANGYGSGTIVASCLNGMVLFSNITVEDCSFSTDTGAGYRASCSPHILFEQIGDGGEFTNITVRKNRFTEPNAQLDIAFVNRGGLSVIPNPTTNPNAKGTVLRNVLIEENVSNKLGYIMLSSDNTSDAAGTKSRGLSAYGVSVLNNSTGFIWLNMSRYFYLGSNGVSSTDYSSGIDQPQLIVDNNKCIGIGYKTIVGSESTGPTDNGLPVVATPSTIVKNNKCSSVYVPMFADKYRDAANDNYPGELIISGNIVSLSKYEASLFDPSDSPVKTINSGYAIYVPSNIKDMSTCGAHVIIEKNIIDSPQYKLYGGGIANDALLYLTGIYCYVPAKIVNNIISKCFSGTGISVGAVTANLTLPFEITGNTIERGVLNVSSYIQVESTFTDKIYITDNYFDSNTINEVSTDLISATSAYRYKVVAQRNKNQSFTVDMIPHFRAEPQYYLGNAYGNPRWWTTSRFSSTSAFYSRTTNVICNVPSPTYGGAPYGSAVLPAIIDLPYVDGATPIKMEFYVTVSNTQTNPDYTGEQIYPLLFYPTLGTLSVFGISNQISFDVGTGTVGAGGYHNSHAAVSVNNTVDEYFVRASAIATTLVSFDLTTLAANSYFQSILSSQRTIPLALTFAKSAGGYKVPIELYTTTISEASGTYDMITLASPKITYRY